MLQNIQIAAVDYQHPIKNDAQSQALPDEDGWDSMRDPKRKPHEFPQDLMMNHPNGREGNGSNPHPFNDDKHNVPIARPIANTMTGKNEGQYQTRQPNDGYYNNEDQHPSQNKSQIANQQLNSSAIEMQNLADQENSLYYNTTQMDQPLVQVPHTQMMNPSSQQGQGGNRSPVKKFHLPLVVNNQIQPNQIDLSLADQNGQHLNDQFNSQHLGKNPYKEDNYQPPLSQSQMKPNYSKIYTHQTKVPHNDNNVGPISQQTRNNTQRPYQNNKNNNQILALSPNNYNPNNSNYNPNNGNLNASQRNNNPNNNNSQNPELINFNSNPNNNNLYASQRNANPNNNNLNASQRNANPNNNNYNQNPNNNNFNSNPNNNNFNSNPNNNNYNSNPNNNNYNQNPEIDTLNLNPNNNNFNPNNNRNGMFQSQSNHKPYTSAPLSTEEPKNKINSYDENILLDNLEEKNPYQINGKKLTPRQIAYIKKVKQILTTDFYYMELPATLTSNVFQPDDSPDRKYVFRETVLPLLAVAALLFFLWLIQLGVKDFCFYNNGFCPCDNFGASLWTFIKQMLAWKLGLLACKNVILIEVLGERDPTFESRLLYIAGIVIDAVFMLGAGLRMDWHFYLAMFILSLILSFHSLKFKQLKQICSRGINLFTYDLNLVLVLVFSYYILPSMYRGSIDRGGFVNGRSLFLYLYPFIEWIIEVFTNQILESAKYGTFFQYQIHHFILGMKVGFMTSAPAETFEFWYLGIFFLIKKILESTNVYYIWVRKQIYLLAPANLKHLVAMREVEVYRKGKEGFHLENIIWIIFYAWWYFTETLVVGHIKTYIIAENCSFKMADVFEEVSFERPILAWLFLVSGQLIALVVNKNLRYDMIKWVGAPKFNLFENIFTRMLGWYLFQIALIVSYFISREDEGYYPSM